MLCEKKNDPLMKNVMRTTVYLLLTVVFLLFVSSCGRTIPAPSPPASSPVQSDEMLPYSEETENAAEGPSSSSSVFLPLTPAEDPSQEEEWAVYWYLCGSDLESKFAAGTVDLEEMLNVVLPDGVTVVIQTGGANTWSHTAIDANKLQRFVYNEDGFNLVDEQPLDNMGHADVLHDFLAFSKENYPAKRIMINIWDHGGGTLAGAAFDELHGMDSLKLPEMYQAISGVFGENKENPPVDILGFDACLMATLDVASTFSGISKYLVASQDLEPVGGWDYTGIFNALAEDPKTEPYELATIICDTYLRICEETGTADIATLSVTDLSKVDSLLEAYNFFACEVLAGTMGDQKILADFFNPGFDL